MNNAAKTCTDTHFLFWEEGKGEIWLKVATVIFKKWCYSVILKVLSRIFTGFLEEKVVSSWRIYTSKHAQNLGSKTTDFQNFVKTSSKPDGFTKDLKSKTTWLVFAVLSCSEILDCFQNLMHHFYLSVKDFSVISQPSGKFRGREQRGRLFYLARIFQSHKTNFRFPGGFENLTKKY